MSFRPHTPEEKARITSLIEEIRLRIRKDQANVKMLETKLAEGVWEGGRGKPKG